MTTIHVGNSIETGKKPSICFVSLKAYRVLSGRDDINHIGGAEVQQVLIAHWLVKRGFSVRFVTLDYGQPDGVNISGITVYKAYEKEAGIRGLRFVYPRWTGLWKALALADADVYYHRGAECETGQVSMWCRLHHRKFIFAAASETDCHRALPRLPAMKDRFLYRVGIRQADAVIAQTSIQQELLLEDMGIRAFCVPNCGRMSSATRSKVVPPRAGDWKLSVLWVGRFAGVKRLEWLLDVANLCPKTEFTVIGDSNQASDYTRSLHERGNQMPNVRLLGRVPYQEMGRYYQDSQVLCCTSIHEGFPNTFLEAWDLGLPVISTFDPDGVIASEGLGWIVQDVDGIVACLRAIITSPNLWKSASVAAKRHFAANHTPDVCLPTLEGILLKIVDDE